MFNLSAVLLKPFMMRYALGFLGERDVAGRQEELVKDKLRRVASTGIGKALGVEPSKSIRELPFTTYQFYMRYFKNPHEGDFIYPLKDYVQAYTSGSMSKPKAFLLPKSSVSDNLMKTGLSFMFISTHDGERVRFEPGDVVYRNIPGGSYLSKHLTGIFDKQSGGWVKQVPGIDLSFDEKVNYFVKHYKEIDTAYMTITTLLDEVYPRIGEPIPLKGFITQDRSATVLSDKIKEITGLPPKVTYGSTETLFSALPSISHPGCFFLDWRVIYPEFIREEESFSSEADSMEYTRETVPLMDVKVGERYQLIATPLKNDFTRYVTPDILECVSRGDDALGMEAPVFSFYGRTDRLVVIHNFTRIAEEELIRVLRESGVEYADFTVRVELDGSREYMVVYVEVKSDSSAGEVASAIHETLLSVDKDYRDLTSMMKYVPVKVRLLPRGAFQRYLRRKDGMPRIERIGMREDRLEELQKTE